MVTSGYRLTSGYHPVLVITLKIIYKLFKTCFPQNQPAVPGGDHSARGGTVHRQERGHRLPGEGGGQGQDER